MYHTYRTVHHMDRLDWLEDIHTSAIPVVQRTDDHIFPVYTTPSGSTFFVLPNYYILCTTAPLRKAIQKDGFIFQGNY